MRFDYDVGSREIRLWGLEISIVTYRVKDSSRETAKYHDYMSNSTHAHISSSNNSAFPNLCNHFLSPRMILVHRK